MIWTLILVIHIMVCAAMILFILLQSGKGADIGATFGGGSSQTVFGSTGAATFLSKITIAAAIIFMCTSFVLTYFAGRSSTAMVERSIMTQTAPGQPVPGPPEGSAQPQGALPSGGKPVGTSPSPESKAPAPAGAPASPSPSQNAAGPSSASPPQAPTGAK
jgi:preprotein translocase subunit SecG